MSDKDICAPPLKHPLISIILCTYNNADSLARTLQQINRCSLPSTATIELLIIDNNSQDHTSRVVENLLKEFHFNTRYLFEGRQGLSHARNTGLENADGHYILFTDDDAEIPVNWLNSYIDQINATKADCLFSKIQILWDQPQPWWFDHRYNPYFVHLDYGNKILTIKAIHHEFFGKNFCVKKTVLEEIGGFDPNLGRQGNKLIAGEETLIYRKLIKNNMKTIYFPDATVGHRLKDREYLESNISKQFIDSAYSSFYLARKEARRLWRNRPLYILKSSLRNILLYSTQWLISLIQKNRENAFYYKLQTKKNLLLLKLWSRH